MVEPDISDQIYRLVNRVNIDEWPDKTGKSLDWVVETGEETNRQKNIFEDRIYVLIY